MEPYDSELEHPKKRRRREIPPRPAAARVTFDDASKGDVATISDQLWSELGFLSPDEPANVCIAISPQSPLHVKLQDSTWTIVPLNLRPFSTAGLAPDQHHHVKLSSGSPSFQAFIKVLTATDPVRYSTHVPKSVDVRVVAVKPVVLDTVYVSVERGLIEKVDEIQNKFGGGFHNYAKTKRPQQRSAYGNDATKDDMSPEDRLTTVIRDGLASLNIVHTGGVVELPLPAHPITHVRPAPAVIRDCEPVSQGYISPKTKIIVIRAGSLPEKTLKRLAPAASIVEESLEDTAEDTSNDQFFSAAEDRQPATASEAGGVTEDDSVTEESDPDVSDEESDSMDDLISMSAPGLPPQPAGTLSAMTAATPRAGGFRASGIHTPGSVYSSFTATTAKAGSRPGKVFRTEALLRQIPQELLHPRPSPEDDEESIVFVDTSTLAKIGSFSGDWVRIEVARNVTSFGFPSILGRFGDNDGEDSDWRAVRVYGLSGLLNQKPRYAVDKTGDRRSSFSQSQPFQPTTPVLYLSPVLLANLANANFVKIGALPKPQRQGPRTSQLSRPNIPKSPPLAREVRLHMVSTPLTTDPRLQSALFSMLKSHFERRRRMLKKGDLIAVPIDEELGRATAAAGENAPELDDVAVKLSRSGRANSSNVGTAWFSVEYVEAEASPDQDDGPDRNNWGGLAFVDVQQSKLTQSAKAIQSISDKIEEWTRYWLGTRTIPARHGRAYDPLVTNADLPLLNKLPLERKIADLVAASTSPRAVNLGLPPLVILLHSNQRQIGKRYIATSACASIGLHTFTISCDDLLSENAATTGGGDVKTEALLQARAERALSCGANQTALLLQHIDLLTADRMMPVLQEIIASSRVLIATTTKVDDVSAGIRSLFTHEFEVSAPDETARELILRNASLLASLPLSPAINLKNLALQTAALVAGDLLDVVSRAALAWSSRLLDLADKQSCSTSDLILSGGSSITQLLPVDFSSAISAARSTFSDAIGAPKIPTVTWQDVGGLSSQKDAILETISLPLTRPELFANGVRKRSGILFYGPPGTGKTLLAKAIATEFSLNFFSVKGPELLNMYIGESEANVRRVFQKARDARPCVVFFDELDSVAPKRGNQGDSGGVMDRIVSQLLAELDGMSGGGGKDSSGESSSSTGGVFVIGATNRPDLLDPALLRPGRFDKMLYLGVADSHDSQVTILEALTRKFSLDSSISLRRIAERLPFTYTGADLYALCSDAMLKAITRKTQAVDQRVAALSAERGEQISTNWFFDHLATKEDVEVVVNESDFINAQRELVGSVSAKELEHFERIRGLFEDMNIGSSSGPNDPETMPRSMSASTIRPNSSATSLNSATTERERKGKGREMTSPTIGSSRPYTPLSPRSRGKQPMPASTPGSEWDTENDYGVSASARARQANGSVDSGRGLHMNGQGKGRGKAHADGFMNDVAGDDDEELYS